MATNDTTPAGKGVTTDAQPTTDDVSPLVRVATIGIDVDPLASFEEYSAAATAVQRQLERITEAQK